jgi:anaerobic selenocysteine-containing dehydrogenase
MEEHVHRAFALSYWVEGARALFPEHAAEIHPDDAARIGVAAGDSVVISHGRKEWVWPVRLVPEQARGSVHVTLPPGQVIRPNPMAVSVRKADV